MNATGSGLCSGPHSGLSTCGWNLQRRGAGDGLDRVPPLETSRGLFPPHLLTGATSPDFRESGKFIWSGLTIITLFSLQKLLAFSALKRHENGES